MAWLFICYSAVAAYFIWTATSLLANYRAARKTGLPIVISPVNPLNPFWILLYRNFPVLPWLRSLPWGLGTFARCSYNGWHFHDKQALHVELGDAFILVNPGINDVFVADPDATHSVLGRRKDFVKPALLYERMDVFGPSVETVEGDDWPRHRKCTAPSFSERTSRLAWTEALRQAHQMLQSWLQLGDVGTTDAAGDAEVLTLHVLSFAGFGIQYSFSEGTQTLRPGYTMTHRDSLHLVLKNLLMLAILPQQFLRSCFPLPSSFRAVGEATLNFKKYMQELVAKERGLISKQSSGAGNLISALIRASDNAKDSKVEATLSQSLSDEEIYGNIFIYNLAGHETTANTVFYAIALLAAYPEWQDWISEEINLVMGEESVTTWDYETTFPKLKRCLAVMLETLRLYNSVVYIPKTTGLHAQTVSLQETSYILPPNTFVTTNVQALHTDPRNWGPDVLTWRPGRWLDATTSTWLEPAKGSFIPWASGPRACPGQKFAQVECVAVLAMLFRKHRVGPALLDGEGPDCARERLRDVIEDSAISVLTLQMRRPREVALVWSARA